MSTTPKCPICHDSGKTIHADGQQSAYLDCVCGAATARAELNQAVAAFAIINRDDQDCDWFIHTRAKAMGRASALAELHPQWLAEKERADRAEARIAELEAQLAAASAPADTDKLRELRARIYEMKEAAYTYGDNSKEAVCAALDGVLDEIDEVASTALQAPVREVPEYKLVPLEVTDVMLEAWKTELCVPIGSSPEAKARRAYRAMLAAAPLPAAPVQQEGE